MIGGKNIKKYVGKGFFSDRITSFGHKLDGKLDEEFL
jgi:hypothetical protein